MAGLQQAVTKHSQTLNKKGKSVSRSRSEQQVRHVLDLMPKMAINWISGSAAASVAYQPLPNRPDMCVCVRMHAAWATTG
jgi:hypothetical protein